MSEIGGVLIVSKTHQMSLECLKQIPLGPLSYMPSGNSITLWETMMTSTQNGPFYVKKGTMVSEYTNKFHTLRIKLEYRGL